MYIQNPRVYWFSAIDSFGLCSVTAKAMCLTASADLIPGPTKAVALVQSCSPTDCYKCVQACFCLLFKFCCHLSEDSRSHYLVFQSIALAKSLTCSATGRHSPGLDSIVLPCAGHDVVSVRSESRCRLHFVALGHQLRNVTPWTASSTGSLSLVLQAFAISPCSRTRFSQSVSNPSQPPPWPLLRLTP